jgi:hypothetical protein
LLFVVAGNDDVEHARGGRERAWQYTAAVAHERHRTVDDAFRKSRVRARVERRADAVFEQAEIFLQRQQPRGPGIDRVFRE